MTQAVRKLVKDNAEGGFPAVEFLCMVAMVAVQGMYSRQNTISAYALAAPNPIVANVAAIVFIP